MRTVIQNGLVSAAIDASRERYPRIDDVYSGLEWRLCRGPQDGAVRSNGFYVWKQNGFSGLNIPTLSALYRFNENEVEVLALRIANASDDADEND